MKLFDATSLSKEISLLLKIGEYICFLVILRDSRHTLKKTNCGMLRNILIQTISKHRYFQVEGKAGGLYNRVIQALFRYNFTLSFTLKPVIEASGLVSRFQLLTGVKNCYRKKFSPLRMERKKLFPRCLIL